MGRVDLGGAVSAGSDGEAGSLLDSLAISIGDVRLSALTVIQALAVITALIAGRG
jgi:hypothetical protein